MNVCNIILFYYKPEHTFDIIALSVCLCELKHTIITRCCFDSIHNNLRLDAVEVSIVGLVFEIKISEYMELLRMKNVCRSNFMQL